MSNQPAPLPSGFRAAGLYCGIKKDPSLKDLAVFLSDRPCAAAGVFTTNLVHGAPVKVSRPRVPRSTARAVLINSGNSNACTGERGIEDAKWMTQLAANDIGCAAEDVLVCSTGVIGRFLPRGPLEAGIPAVIEAAANFPESLQLAATAIMTTDTYPKNATRTVMVGGKTVRVSGVAKGAAMIAPNMATMLGVILTDAAMTPATADSVLRRAVGGSFNCISVDGHMSTSDTVILLANGAAGVSVESLAATDREAIERAICEVAEELATDIIRDAEGATHVITIDVRGARTRDEAFRIAKSIADSPLVKTAVHGADPNWGRIVSAAGYAGVPLREADISLKVNGFSLYEQGTPVAFDATAVSNNIRNNRDTHIDLILTLGDQSVRYWTADLTADYVRLNADYTT